MAPTATIEIEAAVKGDAAQAGLFGPEDIPFGRRSGPVAGIDEAGRGCLAGPAPSSFPLFTSCPALRIQRR